MPLLTVAGDIVFGLSIWLSVHLSVIGFRSCNNVRMAEGIQVKLGASINNDVKMN